VNEQQSRRPIALAVLQLLEGEGQRAIKFSAEQLKTVEFKEHLSMVDCVVVVVVVLVFVFVVSHA
jgi:hypothetical protein